MDIFFVKEENENHTYYSLNTNKASFNINKAVNDTPITKNIKFMPSGRPLSYWMNEKTVGTITIQLYGTDNDSLQISEESTTIEYGDTKKLSILNYSGSIRWESINPEIASVDDSGLVTANGVGTTKIRASLDRMILECKVTIISKNEISLTKTSICLLPNQSDTIKLMGSKSEPTWESLDNTVAKVTNIFYAEDGYYANIYAQGEGTTLIKVVLNEEIFKLKLMLLF